MPKDTVGELMELIAIGQVTRKDIEEFRTTAYNKGVEVGRVEARGQERAMFARHIDEILSVQNQHSDLVDWMHFYRNTLTPLPEVSL